jgi:hypothetical protein
MAEREPGRTAEHVIRAGRIELVDEYDRVRAVVGQLPGLDGRGNLIYGVSVLDHRGKHRVWLEVDSLGPTLAFDQDGQVVVYLGVHDEGSEANNPGPYFSLCDREGGDVLGWRVDPDGEVVETGRQER